mgnify:CR=1 FL=1
MDKMDIPDRFCFSVKFWLLQGFRLHLDEASYILRYYCRNYGLDNVKWKPSYKSTMTAPTCSSYIFMTSGNSLFLSYSVNDVFIEGASVWERDIEIERERERKRASLCVCVCVCVIKRERERERESEIQTNLLDICLSNLSLSLSKRIERERDKDRL